MQIFPVLEADNEGSPSMLSTHWPGSRVTDFTIALGRVWMPYSGLSIGVAGLERAFDEITLNEARKHLSEIVKEGRQCGVREP